MGIEVVVVARRGIRLRVRGRGDPEAEPVFTDRDLVAIVQRPQPDHPPVVDEGAVTAAEILDQNPAPLPDDRGMMSADRRIGNDEVAGGVATDHRPIGQKRDPLPAAGPGTELETKGRHVSPHWDRLGSAGIRCRRDPWPRTARPILPEWLPKSRIASTPVRRYAGGLPGVAGRWFPPAGKPAAVVAFIPDPPGSGPGKPFLGNGVTVARLALNQLV